MAGEFVKGADVSWLAQMEATGYRFLDEKGTPKDCLQILKDDGLNAVRLRVFVNPSTDPRSGHCSPAEAIRMAVRAQKMGFRILIDFHYSDSWADPGKQFKPAAWAGHDITQLRQDVYNHTFQVLKALADAGVTPEWVQVGNEISGGMLWPDGSTRNWPQLAQLLNEGYSAVKAVNPQIKVIIHLDAGDDAGRFRAFFDNFQRQGGRYDVIGLSYYPSWVHKDYTSTIDNLGANLQSLAERYGKEVMVVEVGGEDTKAAATYAMLLAVQKKVREVPGGKGLGIVYWEPEAAQSWSHYEKSAWGANGRPTAALQAFLPGASAQDSGIETPPASVPGF